MSTGHLPEVIRWLLDPKSSPGPEWTKFLPVAPTKRSLIETHISYVILTGGYCVKIKKPCQMGFLDFSSVSLRAKYCRLEVSRNRTFSPEYYLGVVPIKQRGGFFSFGEFDPIDSTSSDVDESTVEYAVVMREFQQDWVLQTRVTAGTASLQLFSDLGQHLATLHRKLSECEEQNCRFGMPHELSRAFAENFTSTSRFIPELLSEQQLSKCKEFTDSFFFNKSDLLSSRLQAGKIKQCHVRPFPSPQYLPAPTSLRDRETYILEIFSQSPLGE